MSCVLCCVGWGLGGFTVGFSGLRRLPGFLPALRRSLCPARAAVRALRPAGAPLWALGCEQQSLPILTGRPPSMPVAGVKASGPALLLEGPSLAGGTRLAGAGLHCSDACLADWAFLARGGFKHALGPCSRQ